MPKKVRCKRAKWKAAKKKPAPSPPVSYEDPKRFIVFGSLEEEYATVLGRMHRTYWHHV